MQTSNSTAWSEGGEEHCSPPWCSSLNGLPSVLAQLSTVLASAEDRTKAWRTEAGAIKAPTVLLSTVHYSSSDSLPATSGPVARVTLGLFGR